jgi:uncharacterized coiled-coil protein SlyX
MNSLEERVTLLERVSASQNERLTALELLQSRAATNLDLVLNYCRELAKMQLSAERIAEIERSVVRP